MDSQISPILLTGASIAISLTAGRILVRRAEARRFHRRWRSYVGKCERLAAFVTGSMFEIGAGRGSVAGVPVFMAFENRLSPVLNHAESLELDFPEHLSPERAELIPQISAVALELATRVRLELPDIGHIAWMREQELSENLAYRATAKTLDLVALIERLGKPRKAGRRPAARLDGEQLAAKFKEMFGALLPAKLEKLRLDDDIRRRIAPSY